MGVDMWNLTSYMEWGTVDGELMVENVGFYRFFERGSIL
jgi:hypothetical protein